MSYELETSKSVCFQLKKRIKELAAEGRAIRRQSFGLQGFERHDAWNRKRDVGATARGHLLIYGFARGTPYRRIEASCQLSTRPSARSLARVLCRFQSDSANPKTLEEQLKVWLEKEPSTTGAAHDLA